MNTKKLITQRNNRKNRVRSRLKKRSDLPRLVITRSLNHISAQLIDFQGNVQAEATSKNQSFKGKTKLQQATEVGKIMAGKLSKLKITNVVLDRGHYKYHGRIKALAEAALNNK